MNNNAICLVALLATLGMNTSGSADWELGPELGTVRSQCAAAADGKGGVYAAGGRVTWSPGIWTPGRENGTALNSVEMFDESSGVWVPLPPMITHRENVAMACVNGFLYVFGGGNCFSDVPCEVYDSCERLDLLNPGAGWVEFTNMSIPRMNCALTVDAFGRIYVIGGDPTNPQGPSLSLVERYDPARDTWEILQSLPVGWGSGGAATDGHGRVYAIGGAVNLGAIRTVLMLDESEQWVEVSSIPMDLDATQSVPMAVGADGRFYTAGGNIPQGPVLNRCIRFDPETGVWEEITPMPVTLYPGSNSMTTDAKGRIWLLGGNVGITPLATVQILNGPCGSDQARPLLLDTDAGGEINVTDLLQLLARWGSCP